MQRVRQRVVDGIDFRVGDHLGVGAQNTLDTVLFGEELGTASIACGDGDQPVTQLLGWSDDGEIGDSGCTEHPDPQAHTVTLRHTFCMIGDTGLHIAQRAFVGRLVIEDGVLLHHEPAVKPVAPQRA